MRRGVCLLVVLLIGLVSALSGNVVERSVGSSISVGISFLVSTFDGATSVFTGKTTYEIQNFNDVTLEKTSYGKVVFNEVVNFSKVANASNVVDFDRYLTISNNLVSINNFMLPYLNKSVTISIYNLNYVLPEILHDGVVCSDCTQISYEWGILVFTAENFSSSYSVREGSTLPICGNGVCEAGEDCSSCSADCGTCPVTPEGAGAVTPSLVYDFALDKDILLVELTKGEHYQKQVKITNNGTGDIFVTISIPSLEQYVFPETDRIFLRAGESKIVSFDIYFSDRDKADVYVGKINFAYGTLQKSVRVILDVKDKAPLFDIETSVLKKYVLPGERILANVTVLNLGDLKNIDVELEYYILDFDNKTYDIKKESFAIYNFFSKIIFLESPKDMPMGDYLFYSKVSYGDVSASSYDLFVIEKISFTIWFLALLIFLVSIVIIVLVIRRKKKNEN
ncbi:MAG: hypothetical protein ABH804_01845 [archaeon]